MPAASRTRPIAAGVLVEITPLARRRALEIYAPFTELSFAGFDGYTVGELEVITSFLARSIELPKAQLEKVRPPATRAGSGAARRR
jgi:hypothetical protein